jgi:hypothetical protein
VPDGIRLPGARWKPFTERSVSALPWTGPGAIIGHTIVGTRDGAWDYHNEPGQPYVQLYYDGHGEALQVTGLEYRAAGTLQLNPHVIAIEVADKGPGFPTWNSQCGNVPAMTDAQVEALIRDCAWMCVALGIDPRELQSTCEALPGGLGGIGWHRMGIDPWRAPGCPLTSKAEGKCCPDWRRIGQWHSDIIPGVRALVLGHKPPTPTPDPEDDMPTIKIRVAPAAASAPETYSYLLPDGTLVDLDYNGGKIDANDAVKFDKILLAKPGAVPLVNQAQMDQVQRAVEVATRARFGTT